MTQYTIVQSCSDLNLAVEPIWTDNSIPMKLSQTCVIVSQMELKME